MWKNFEYRILQNVLIPSLQGKNFLLGVCLGVGLYDLEHVVDTTVKVQSKGFRAVSPFFIPRILVNMAAGLISIKHQFQGPNHCVSTACTTGEIVF